VRSGAPGVQEWTAEWTVPLNGREPFLHTREYLLYYRGPGVCFGFPLPLPPSVRWHSFSACLCRRSSFLTGEGGGGLGRSKIIYNGEKARSSISHSMLFAPHHRDSRRREEEKVVLVHTIPWVVKTNFIKL
jgi:hypothetical protein